MDLFEGGTLLFNGIVPLMEYTLTDTQHPTLMSQGRPGSVSFSVPGAMNLVS